MTITTQRNTDTHAVQSDTAAQAGVQKYLGSQASLQMDGGTTTPAAIKATLQADIDATGAAEAAKADYAAKVAAKRAARATARKQLMTLRRYVLSVYGADAKVFADFAFKLPAAAGPKTVAAKAQQVAQAKATRKARGTEGPTAKAKIKGVVAPVVEAPAAPVAPGAVTPATK